MAAKLQANILKNLSGHTAGIYALAPDGYGGFFSAGGDGMLVHWTRDSSDGVLLARVPDNVYSMAWFPAAQSLLAGTRGGELFMLKDPLNAQYEVRRFTAHSGGLFGMLVIGDDFYSSGGDGRVIKWNAQLEIVAEARVSKSSTRALLAFGGGLLAGSSDHHIRMLNSRLETIDTWAGHENSVFALEALPDGRIVSGGRDAVLRIWKSGAEAGEAIKAHLLHIHDLKLSPGGQWLASGSMDKSVKIWDASTLELLKVIDRPRMEAHSASVNRLLWLDERTLVSAGDDRRILLTEIQPS